jgi:hypothetical protein
MHLQCCSGLLHHKILPGKAVAQPVVCGKARLAGDEQRSDMMAENKTKPENTSVAEFVCGIEHVVRRADAEQLLSVFKRITAMNPCMWGESMIGYGQYHYKYDSGREGDYFLTGFAPRRAATTIYIMPGFSSYENQLELLGPHRHSSSCLYITRLARVNLTVLEGIIADSVERMKDKYFWKA